MLFEKGVALAKEEKLEEARLAFTEVTGRQPDFGPAYYYLGVIQMKRDNMAEASGFFETAIEHGTAGPMVQYLLATTLVRGGEIERAKASYLEAIRQNPRMTVAWRDLGILCYGSKEYDKSVNFLRKAYELDPTASKVLWLLGMAYIQDGQSENAVEMITALRKLNEEEKATDLEAILRKIHGKDGIAAPAPPSGPASTLNPNARIKGRASPFGGRAKIKGKATITNSASSSANKNGDILTS